MDAFVFFSDNGKIVAWLMNFSPYFLGGIFVFLLVKLSGSLEYFEQMLFTSTAKNESKKSRRMIEKVSEIREKYDLTEKGFLPEFCLEKLPDYYKEWEEVALKLPELNRLGKLKEEVLKMKLLSCDYLTNDILLRRAYILLGMLVHSYVNGESAVWSKLKNESDIVNGQRKNEDDFTGEEIQVKNNRKANGGIDDISRSNGKRKVFRGEESPSGFESNDSDDGDDDDGDDDEDDSDDDDGDGDDADDNGDDDDSEDDDNGDADDDDGEDDDDGDGDDDDDDDDDNDSDDNDVDDDDSDDDDNDDDDDDGDVDDDNDNDDVDDDDDDNDDGDDDDNDSDDDDGDDDDNDSEDNDNGDADDDDGEDDDDGDGDDDGDDDDDNDSDDDDVDDDDSDDDDNDDDDDDGDDGDDDDACAKRVQDIKEESPVGGNPSGKTFSNIPNIPSQLAIPWCTVCKRLDMPLVLTAAMDLWNWKLKDDAKSHDLSTLTSLNSMTGTNTEIFFHMVPCAMQYVAAPLIPQILALYHNIADAKINADNSEYMYKNLLSFIADLATVFKKFKDILTRIKDFVDVDAFYDIYRPLLNGFWPDGVFFNLVHDDHNDDDDDDDDDGSDYDHDRGTKFQDKSFMTSYLSKRHSRTIKDHGEITGIMNKANSKEKLTKKNGSLTLDFLTHGGAAFNSVIKKRLPSKGIIANPKGPSAGQSTMILLFDLLLGIKHRGSGEDFQDEMANYMPPRHRQMIFDLRNLVQQYGTLRDVIIRWNNLSLRGNLVSTYNECIKAVADFRSLHLGIAVKYLVRTKRGTGASSFRDMLNEMVSSTKQATIELKSTSK